MTPEPEKATPRDAPDGDGGFADGVRACTRAFARVQGVKALADQPSGVQGELQTIARTLAGDTVQKLCPDRASAEEFLRAAGFSPSDFPEATLPKR